jgi:hypothetical protein
MLATIILFNKVTTRYTTVTAEEQKWDKIEFLLLWIFLSKVHYRKKNKEFDIEKFSGLYRLQTNI